MKDTLILIRYGELSLKSPYVRRYFESILIRNISRALTQEKLQGTITKDRGRIYLRSPHTERCSRVLRRIFGVVSFSPTVETTADLDQLSTVSLQLMRETLLKHQSFAIRATRTGTHPFTSQDIAVRVGHDIVQELHAPVDLSNPDVELFLEIRNTKAFLFTQKIKGVGGLPLGTQGTVLSLVDTPGSLLAAWYLMHRGCEVVFATANKSGANLLQQFCKRWYLTLASSLVNPHSNGFYRDLDRIAMDHHCDALVSGHTLEHPKTTLATMSKWKQHSVLPMLTPLIAMNEKEIKVRCRRLGIQV
jgi:thiamine biosynthesis protein ThiI